MTEPDYSDIDQLMAMPHMNWTDDWLNVSGKLRRAAVHLRTFEAEQTAYLQSAPFSFERRDRTVGEVKVIDWYLKVNAWPPNDLNHIASDVVHNLRSALNQAIVLWTGTKNVPDFPIRLDDRGWQQWLTKAERDGAHLSDEQLSFLYQWQPFVALQSKGAARDFTLRIVSAYDNEDKHLGTPAVIIGTSHREYVYNVEPVVSPVVLSDNVRATFDGSFNRDEFIYYQAQLVEGADFADLTESPNLHINISVGLGEYVDAVIFLWDAMEETARVVNALREWLVNGWRPEQD